jgi:hypothetical protein
VWLLDEGKSRRSRNGKREQAQQHLTIATMMYREMGMTYWLGQRNRRFRRRVNVDLLQASLLACFIASHAASRATACAPIRCRSRSSASAPSGRVEGRAPTSLVVLNQLQVEALTVHPDGDMSDAGQESSYEPPRWSSTRSLDNLIGAQKE